LTQSAFYFRPTRKSVTKAAEVTARAALRPPTWPAANLSNSPDEAFVIAQTTGIDEICVP